MRQSAIWDHFQNEQVDSFDGSRGRLSFIIKHINKGEKVLNIGVGNGLLEKLSLEKNIDIYCVDPGDRAIRRLWKEESLSNRALVAFSQNLPIADNCFDVIIMSEVLEHLDTPILYETLNEVFRVLKNGGQFIGTVPANEELDESTVVCPKCHEKFHRWGHVQSFSKQKLQELFTRKDEVSSVCVKEYCFTNFKGGGFKGGVKDLLRLVAFYTKLYKPYTNYFFKVKKA